MFRSIRTSERWPGYESCTPGDPAETEGLPAKLILQVHDELVFELPRAEAEVHAKWISDEMTSAIQLDVPLKVDITVGPNWLSGK